jgi:putative FmdB family regulatory protein
MPTYEYKCPAGHEFDLFQKMSERPRAKCPTCGRQATRKISGGAGLVFKGSGFYITDYGKDGKGPRKESSGKGDSNEPTPATGELKAKGDAKNEARSDAKSDAKPATESQPDKPPTKGEGKGKGRK